ncbi:MULTISPECIES: hypothetical protein [Agrobacterium]|uniref:hypothetical protein n=1 Tax=Agrobacterium TaxID=357 RepID=UPI0009BC5EB7|nr:MULTISPECIES: hypothetical protein [Agrobacterium]QCL75633.1 hypothetical protein CFBP5499_19285 [Agrobacterium tumefaciens]CUX57301.1 conserved hypothetical protein [Agrobacterium sp. NCPPB 925]
MTQLHIGLDYEGVGSVKITKGAYDPGMTHDNTLGAFLYNSKFAIQAKIAGRDTQPYRDGDYNYPPGASNDNFTMRSWRYPSTVVQNRVFYRAAYFPGLNYTLPLFEVLVRRITDNYYVNARSILSSYGHESRGERIATVMPLNDQSDFGWKLNNRTIVDNNYRTFGDLLQLSNIFAAVNTGNYNYLTNELLVWNLPGDEAGIVDAQPLPPNPEHFAVNLDSTGLKVAKPGYNVDTAFGTQLAFDSSNRPTKIVAADDIVVPSGGSEYALPMAVPDGTMCIVNFYTGSTVIYPANPHDAPSGADWRIAGDRLYFSNPNGACRARFMVVAYDQTPPTAGNNDVFRMFTANGEDVIQFLRPGAGDPPAFADIIVDSRWPAISLLAQGYFGVGGGTQNTAIPIDTTNFYPIVRYMTVHSGYGGQNGGDESYSKMIRPPITARYRLNHPSLGFTWRDSGDSSFVTIQPNAAVFTTFSGNPAYARLIDNGGGSYTVAYNYPSSPVIGIRYYIFGIPKKD